MAMKLLPDFGEDQDHRFMVKCILHWSQNWTVRRIMEAEGRRLIKEKDPLPGKLEAARMVRGLLGSRRLRRAIAELIYHGLPEGKAEFREILKGLEQLRGDMTLEVVAGRTGLALPRSLRGLTP